MSHYNAIVIDDEQSIRDALNDLLVQFCPEINICGLAGSAQEGRMLLAKHRIDIIFLDISMPKEDGFTFLESISQSKYRIIFATAHQEFAIRALKACAIDYLLKPINPYELKEAVNKAIAYYEVKDTKTALHDLYSESLINLQKQLKSKSGLINRITVPEQFGFQMVDVSDLMYLEANNSYTNLHLVGEHQILTTRTLGEFERILDNPEFYRIHKSVMINLNYLKGFSSYQGYFAELKDGSRLMISRRRLVEFRDRVKHFSIFFD
jgi:two-component system LytT family response regulator